MQQPPPQLLNTACTAPSIDIPLSDGHSNPAWLDECEAPLIVDRIVLGRPLHSDYYVLTPASSELPQTLQLC